MKPSLYVMEFYVELFDDMEKDCLNTWKPTRVYMCTYTHSTFYMLGICQVLYNFALKRPFEVGAIFIPL